MRGFRGALIAAFVLVGLGGTANAATPWRDLQRPLDLPRIDPGSDCPISKVDNRVDWPDANIFGGFGTGRGPVYPGLGGDPVGQLTADSSVDGGALFRAKVFWYATPDYTNRALIRGGRIDGPGRLQFSSASQGRGRSWDLRMGLKSDTSWTGKPKGSRGTPSSVYAPRSGCYAVQIDGGWFSRTVVFTVSTP